MKPMIVYCHGYGSSAKTDKVERLKKFGDVYAWDINPETPQQSISSLDYKTFDVLLDNFTSEELLIFVGTSLGAWYAWKLGKLFDAQTILLNPCYNPKEMLKKFGIDTSGYDEPITPRLSDYVVIGDSDEVIEFSQEFKDSCPNLDILPGVTHRFNGPEFEETIQKILDGLKVE